MESLESGSLWSLVRALESQAVREWRKEKRPAEELETALVNDASRIETTVSRRQDGNVSVTVSVIGVRPGWHMVQHFALQRIGKDAYRTFVVT